MIRVYQSPVIGTGTSPFNARRPEFTLTENVTWELIEDLGDTMVVQIELANFTGIDNYPDTVRL